MGRRIKASAVIVGIVAVTSVVALAMGSAPATEASGSPSTPSGSVAFTRRLATGDTASLFIADASGEGAHRLVTGDPIESAGSAIWSPDGASLLITNTIRWSGDVLLPFRPAVVASDGSDYRLLQVPGGPRDMFCPTWTPDGEAVLCSFGGAWRGIYAIPTTGGGAPIRITHNPFRPGHDYPGSYSPDGEHLVFLRTRSGSGPLHPDGGALFVKNLGGASHRITPYGLPQWEEYGWAVQWSPDGSQIVFASVDGSHGYLGHLYVVNPDGTGLRRIHLDTGGQRYTAWAPDWSPDGSRIIFSMWLGDHPDIYTADPDGTDIEPVTDTRGWENSADWKP